MNTIAKIIEKQVAFIVVSWVINGADAFAHTVICAYNKLIHCIKRKLR